jgi:hypothetical protein
VNRLARWLAQPQEALFFLFIGAFALVIGIIYWLASGEPAGTVLMVLFGVATGLLGLRLAIDPRARLARRRAAEQAVAVGGRRDREPDMGDRLDLGGRGQAGEGTGGIERPFLDESGRLPAESFAPFALGLGIAIASTGLIFGLAPVIVGLLPSAWGAWTWLSGARAELDASEAGARNLQGDRTSHR